MAAKGNLQIRLIGDCAVLRNGDPVALPSSRKTRGLLAFLVLCPGPHRRERLCELFWEIADDPRGALRWSLTKLRRVVDDDDTRRIVANRDTVAFDPKDVDVDVLQLRETLSGGPEDLDTATLKCAASAAAAGLLEGLNLGGQPDFEHFISGEREAFRTMHRDLLLELIGRLDQAPAEAVPYLQKLVEIEPYSMRAHYALIEKLVKAGRKRDAESQLQSSLSILKDLEGADLTAIRRAAAGKPAPSDTLPIAAEDEPAGPVLDQEIRFCQSADGTRIAYATVGKGPPLIKTANWLNHLDFDWESPVWRHVFHGLADGRRLIRYDARGNGLSDWDAEDFSLERQVEDLEAVVDSTGLDRFPLFGISQGCANSVAYAARHPERVSRLILIGGYARGWNRIGRNDVVRQTHAMMTLVGIGWGKDNPAFRQMFTSMFMPDAPPENQSWFNELQRISTTGKNAVRLMQANGDVDITDMLTDVRAPTLVMHCKNDMRIPFESGRELAIGIPGARFVSLDSRNHLPPETDPAWPVMLREINEFLSD